MILFLSNKFVIHCFDQTISSGNNISERESTIRIIRLHFEKENVESISGNLILSETAHPLNCVITADWYTIYVHYIYPSLCTTSCANAFRGTGYTSCEEAGLVGRECVFNSIPTYLLPSEGADGREFVFSSTYIYLLLKTPVRCIM